MNESQRSDRASLSRRSFLAAAGAGVGLSAAALAGCRASGSRAVGGATLGGSPETRFGAGDTAAQPFSVDLPYASTREPVYAQEMVATSQPLAAQAGLEMLRRGGNAVDAAVATAATLTVVEPTANGIGGDNFALIWKDGEVYGLNASGRSPRRLQRSDFDGLDEVPFYDWRAVTVPGAPSGWAAALERFGSLDLETVLGPAIEYARSGFPCSAGIAQSWSNAARRYRGSPLFEAWQRTFAPNGRGPMPGELVRLPDHARTLAAIARTNAKAFYEGEIAEAIDRAARDAEAALRADDLRAHEPAWVEPIHLDYQGLRLHEIPPNGQGIAALSMLGALRHFDIASMDADSPEALHIQVEAMKLAFADAHRHVADPRFMDVSPERLLDAAYLEARARRIDRARAQDFDHGIPKPGGTVLLTAADRSGMMVSFIQSNYTGFGSGIVVPGTGVALHNRGACFTLEPGHPNEAGPDKLPYHTIIPAMVTEAGDSTQPVMSFGVMGGFMQPQGHAQVLSRVRDWRQNPQAALDAPRWQVTRDKRVLIEPGFAPEVYDALRRKGHDLQISNRRNARFGRGQAIYRLDHAYVGASDQRADGQAVGR